MAINRQQKAEMRDYLVSRLKDSAGRVDFKTSRFDLDGDTNYLQVGADIVFLVDRVFTSSGFNRTLHILGARAENVMPVFYKDGVTFFRNAAHGVEAGLKGVRYKSQQDLSLKHYTQEQINRMILARPEERHLINLGRFLQYYQPQSVGLEQGVETFKFGPVTYDYTHLPNGAHGKMEERSERLFLWLDRGHSSGALFPSRGYLRKYVSASEVRPVGYTPQVEPATSVDRESHNTQENELAFRGD